MSRKRTIVSALLASAALCSAAWSQDPSPAPQTPVPAPQAPAPAQAPAPTPQAPAAQPPAPTTQPADTPAVTPAAPAANANRDSAAVKSAAKAANTFGTSVLNHLLGPGAGTTVMVSPYSINSALDMLTLGAGGNTAKLLRAKRGIAPSPQAAAAQAALNHVIADASTPDVTIRLANSVWLTPKAKPLPPFVTAVHDGYDAEVTNVDFANPATLDAVNGWVKQHTQDVIPRIVDTIDPKTEFLLVNTTYFKGKWDVPFEAAQTKPAPFTRADGSKHDVPMMNATLKLGYMETPLWHAVAIPYHGDRFEMIVMTAKKPADSAAVRKQLGDRGFLQALQGAKSAARDVNLHLPRFRAEYGTDLTAVLTTLGLGPALGGQADYQAMTSARLQATKVVHRAVVDVNEEGTEAAASTAVIGTRSAAPNMLPPVEFAADRPFAFGIVDRTSGAILFLGYVADPAG